MGLLYCPDCDCPNPSPVVGRYENHYANCPDLRSGDWVTAMALPPGYRQTWYQLAETISGWNVLTSSGTTYASGDDLNDTLYAAGLKARNAQPATPAGLKLVTEFVDRWLKYASGEDLEMSRHTGEVAGHLSGLITRIMFFAKYEGLDPHGVVDTAVGDYVDEIAARSER